MNDFLKKLGEGEVLTNTTLETQITFMEGINSLYKTPMSIAIINSLKELRGIKQNQINKSIKNYWDGINNNEKK